jgi:hypothetical protein
LKFFLIIALTVIFTSITIPAYADITIIEVEANPVGPDEGNEWAILFNSGNKQVSLSGWGIASTQGGKSQALSGSIGSCEQKSVFFSDEFVYDELESLVLYDHAGKVVDSTSIINDIANNTATWKTEIPNCERSQQQSPESNSVVEPIAVQANSTSEIIEENENDSLNLGITIQGNEEFIEVLTPILPYLGIIIALVIGAIILKNKKRSRRSKNNERDIESEYATLENAPLLKKFQDMQVGQEYNNANNIQPTQIIKNKLRIISKLQENKIGDNDRLEAIKKSLKTGGDFTKGDNDYLETKYEEYKKISKKDSDE